MEYLISKQVNDLYKLSQLLTEVFQIDFNSPGNFLTSNGNEVILVCDKEIDYNNLIKVINTFKESDAS